MSSMWTYERTVLGTPGSSLVSITDLVDEENTGGDLRLALLPPLGHLRVDLVPDLSNESLSGN